MAFEACANSSRAVEEVTTGETFVAMSTESIFRYHEAGISALVVTVITFFISKGGMFRALIAILLLHLCGS